MSRVCCGLRGPGADGGIACLWAAGALGRTGQLHVCDFDAVLTTEGFVNLNILKYTKHKKILK